MFICFKEDFDNRWTCCYVTNKWASVYGGMLTTKDQSSLYFFALGICLFESIISKLAPSET